MTSGTLQAAAPAAEVVELIEARDTASLAEVVDIAGLHVDMPSILNATADDLDRRLQTLADLVGARDRGSVTDSVDAVATAQQVLSQAKYETGGESTFERLGSLLIAWFETFIDWLTSSLGGPTTTGLIVLGAVVVFGLAAFTFLARRRSSTVEREVTLERLIAEGGDPDALEQSAAEAARHGRFADAVRSRFLAGLLRLDIAGRITFRTGLTTGEIADTLRDADFDSLMDTFNDVVYGGREATAQDYESADEHWARLLTRRPVDV